MRFTVKTLDAPNLQFLLDINETLKIIRKKKDILTNREAIEVLEVKASVDVMIINK